MSHLTFLQMLKSEVARMQTAHPEREGELARAHALILHGQVLPSTTNPDEGTVLSSDGSTTYTVNGVCTCPAGAHGKDCKHLHAWKLYQYITRKLAAQAPPEAVEHPTPAPLPEAPASLNMRVMLYGHEVQITLRDVSEDKLIDRLATLVRTPGLRPVAKAQPRPWRKGGAR